MPESGSEIQSGSHREPERDRERASKSKREPQREPVRARLTKTLFVATRQNTVFFVENCQNTRQEPKKWLQVR